MLRTAVSNWLYDKGPGRYYRPAYAQMAQAVGPQAGSFLDVGCGPGRLSIHVAAAFGNIDVVGIDISARMLAYASRHSVGLRNIRFECVDACSTSFPSESFSAAAAVQTVHHWRSTPEILTEVHRVLAPGARLFIYEADRHLKEVPAGWVDKRGGWPPDGLVRLGWRRFGMDAEEWAVLCTQAEASPFSSIETDRHGFYRRMVLTR